MTPFARLGPRGRIARLREAARAALPRFGLAPGPLPLVADHENTTFLWADGATRLAVRVHRAGYHAPEAVRCEARWVEALAAARPGLVPAPRRTRDGDVLAVVDGPGLDAPRAVAVLAWLPGRRQTRRGPLWAERVGALTAALHAHAASWPRPEGWRRPTWDGAGLLAGAGSAWAPPEGLPGLSRRERHAVAGLRRDLAAELARWPRGPADFGLLHADLHVHNVHVHRGRALALDFDDCGDGWWWYDPAVSLALRGGRGPDPRLLAAWARGYEAERPLPPAGAERLPALWLARRLVQSAWFAADAAPAAVARFGPPFREALRATLDAWRAGRLAAAARAGLGA